MRKYTEISIKFRQFGKKKQIWDAFSINFLLFPPDRFQNDSPRGGEASANPHSCHPCTTLNTLHNFNHFKICSAVPVLGYKDKNILYLSKNFLITSLQRGVYIMGIERCPIEAKSTRNYYFFVWSLCSWIL